MAKFQRLEGEPFIFTVCDGCLDRRGCITDLGSFGLRKVVHAAILQESASEGLVPVDVIFDRSQEFNARETLGGSASKFLEHRECGMTKEEVEQLMRQSEEHYSTKISLKFE